MTKSLNCETQKYKGILRFKRTDGWKDGLIKLLSDCLGE